jgi:hypothetical protein
MLAPSSELLELWKLISYLDNATQQISGKRERRCVELWRFEMAASDGTDLSYSQAVKRNEIWMREEKGKKER